VQAWQQRTGGHARATMICGLVVLRFWTSAAETEETWTTGTLAGDGTEGYLDGSGATKFGFLDFRSNPTLWLVGVTVMDDDRTAVLIDNYNQVIRKIDLRTSETTTVAMTKASCEPNKCLCGSDLTQECNDPRRHTKAAQLSGIVGFSSTVFYSNRWNDAAKDTSAPAIWRINLKDAVVTPTRVPHKMSTMNVTFAPFGIAKGTSAAELIFTNYGASLCKMNIYSGEITYIAGPAIRGLPREVPGYQDGFGANVQVASPMGITTDSARKYSYFVDSGLCNIRRLDLSTLGVTTLAGPSKTKSDGSFQCSYADGIGDAIRFTAPVGIAYLAGNRLAVSDARDHLLRIVSIDDLSSKTIGGVRGQSGWVDGVQPGLVRFNNPSGVATTSNGGTIIVTDQGSNRVRSIDKNCAPFYIGARAS
jgi:hypothetical protein